MKDAARTRPASMGGGLVELGILSLGDLQRDQRTGRPQRAVDRMAEILGYAVLADQLGLDVFALGEPPASPALRSSASGRGNGKIRGPGSTLGNPPTTRTEPASRCNPMLNWSGPCSWPRSKQATALQVVTGPRSRSAHASITSWRAQTRSYQACYARPRTIRYIGVVTRLRGPNCLRSCTKQARERSRHGAEGADPLHR
jgi:hypothetical protein